MREILFRGKSIIADSPNDKRVNYWVEGSFVHETKTYDGGTTNEYYIVEPGQFHDYDFSPNDEVWPETIGQFTGLLDKNGKKIFEGDIVTINGAPEKRYYQIKFGHHRSILCYSPNDCSEAYGFYFEETTEDIYNCKFSDSLNMYVLEKLEVIGNIHDNPELLEVKDNG